MVGRAPVYLSLLCVVNNKEVIIIVKEVTQRYDIKLRVKIAVTVVN